MKQTSIRRISAYKNVTHRRYNTNIVLEKKKKSVNRTETGGCGSRNKMQRKFKKGNSHTTVY